MRVRGELRKLRPRKAAGPDRVCPRLLKTCAAELGEPLQRVFNLSLELGKVPTLWKTSCIIPVPKKNRPSELNDFWPVALTSHLMKTLERLFLNLLRPQVQHAEDSLQFAYRDKVGVEDAIIYLLHRVHSHLDKGSGTARILFLDFSSAFNTIQPLVLQDKLLQMRVDPCLVAWISSYLTDRPQFVRMKDITSDTVVSSIGAPQGTVLSPILFTLYTSDFCYNSEMCHIQKFADDTAIVGCIRDDQEEESTGAWDRLRPRPVQIGTEEVEGVQTYKYLGLWLDNRLDWTSNTRQLYKKTQSRMYFLRRLRSFNICRKLLWMFYQLEKLIRRASSVVGMKLEPLATVAERRTIDKLRSIMDNDRHPLHTVLHSQRSLISQRLRLPKEYDREQFAENPVPLLLIGTKFDQIPETKRSEVLTRTAFLSEDFNAEEINLDCTNPRYLAAGTSNAVKLSRFFDKVRKSALFTVMQNFPEMHQIRPLC
ncbi:Rab-like protein 3 [Takifugu flavidus]|uniref:Rab-like protein 3 n=1 Tax=Takifugu flavidus TaxID=433684 RepID=A0A5C6PMF9_9TELE|nr:Rab-like protein 3 [Takifugu flavidus]